MLVDDVPVDKAGHRVSEDAAIRVRGQGSRFVSRGGEKLAGALEDLGVDASGASCLDVGASTGGFTDCLLAAGARHVVALDVGHGQFHSRLRVDPRVLVHERVNARQLEAAHLGGEEVDLLVADVSFISLRLLIPRFAVVAPRADWLLLVKPQFEVGRERVGKGGVVRDERDRRAAVESVVAEAGRHGHGLAGQVDSRLAGPKGNREIFVHLRAAASRSPDAPCDTLDP